LPGLALGDTRAQVEAGYGGPEGCQDTEVTGTDVNGEKIKIEMSSDVWMHLSARNPEII
jgi:hypothetical protein